MRRTYLPVTVLAMSMVAVLLALLGPRAMAVPKGEVIIGQQVVLRVRFPAGGMTVQERVDNITARLNKLLGIRAFDPSLITVRRHGGDYGVLYRDELLVTADAQTAAYNKASAQELANLWAANMRKVIPLAKATRP